MTPAFLFRNRITAVLLALSCTLPVHAASPAEPDGLTPDGGKYYGQLVNGKFQSQGRIEWANGAHYEGNFEQGQFSGKGSYRDSNGQHYEGEYQHGTFNGNGKLVLVDGSVYVGQMANGAFNGTGKFTTANGVVYVGAFVNNAFQGVGKITTPTEEYTGNFNKGTYDGQGSLVYKNGTRYTGQFVGGAPDGQGRFEFPNGRAFEGQFKQGNFDGHGIFESKREGRHVGAFKDWRPIGPGKFTKPNGDTYEGNFGAGGLEGAGIYIGKDGARYDGQFKDSHYEGQGVLRTAKGDVYRGQFKFGRYDGKGELTYATPQKDGRTNDVGTWSFGRLDDPQEEKRVAMNVESALYNQNALLEAQFGPLQPHQPGKINMYLLAVGGYGEQEVFRREIEYVQAQFDHQYGTAGRSAVLVNSRTTVAKYPMATKTSIEQGLHRVAERMDKQNDILFLFLTSHGSRDHQLSLSQSGMELQSLPAQDLGVWLKQSGIRWKVIVVSACYSGGFIAPLKDDHTLVITAARSDRTSFGCADDNDFTYFSEAFFKDALPRSTSFGAAFERAKLLVKAREAVDFAQAEQALKDKQAAAAQPGGAGATDQGEDQDAGKDADADESEDESEDEGVDEGEDAAPVVDTRRYHSEPQISQGKAIEQYLKQWRAQLSAATVVPAPTAGAALTAPITAAPPAIKNQ